MNSNAITIRTHSRINLELPATRTHTDVELRRVPRLIESLYKTAAMRGETKSELARHVGVSYGYLSQLSSGLRSVETISSEFARACARYLDIPPVAVMLASGRIKAVDFLMPEAGPSPSIQLNRGLERIASDPIVGCLLPAEIWDAPDSVKTLLVALYEDVTQQELLPPRRMLSIFQALQDAAVALEDIDAENAAAATANYLANESGNV